MEYYQTFHVIRNVPWLRTTEPIKSPDKNAERFILYQGALNEGRGLETLIEAMKGIDMPLYLAGEGGLSRSLRQQVKAAGLSGKIHFLGYVKPQALSTLTAQAFIGYNVLENKGLNYYYSLPNKFFDYMHAGVPILTNDFPEYRRIDENYHVACLIALKQDEIIEAVHYLTAYPEVYQRMVNNCLNGSRVFNWNEEEKHLLNLYDNFFQRKHASC